MQLVVKSDDRNHVFLGLWEYVTDDGELDILDQGITIRTFARGTWDNISRSKEEHEEWPRELLNPLGEEEDKPDAPDETPPEIDENGMVDIPGVGRIKIDFEREGIQEHDYPV